jgi:hypothetical protein
MALREIKRDHMNSILLTQESAQWRGRCEQNNETLSFLKYKEFLD